MGFEWEIKLKSTSITEATEQIYKCLVDEGIQNIQIDSEGISVLNDGVDCEKWPLLMEIVKNDGYFYVLSHGFAGDTKIIQHIEQQLTSMDCDFIVEEL